jgi:ABC-2 type transport system ATP-binding protein
MLTTIEHDLPQTSERPRPSAPVAVSVRNLSKRFRVRRRFADVLRHPFRKQYMQALNDVNCEIRSGEFFGFLGSNGAGKTTLFKILATLVSPDQGTVTVDGLDVTANAAGVRRVLTPVIADERSLRWRLTSRENLRLYAVLYGIPSRQVARRVDEVLEVVGLDPSDTKLAGRFSSGMRQRLLIARALIPQPKVLLLDEPTRSLDPVSARNLRTFLREEICKRHGCTILLATHTAEEAFELCDRVAILDRGRPVAVGEAAALQLRFGENRFRLCTRTPDHPALEVLARKDVIRNVTVRVIDEAGWTTLDMDVPSDAPGALESAAQVVQYLVGAGVEVARFERIELSLGDLIQRVVERGAGGSGA